MTNREEQLSDREKWLMQQAMDTNGYYKSVDDYLNDVISDHGHTVEMALAHDAPRPDEWIPVSERLPDEGQRVWVCLDEPYQGVLRYNADTFSDRKFRRFHSLVTHWMLRPQPPEGE